MRGLNINKKKEKYIELNLVWYFSTAGTYLIGMKIYEKEFMKKN
jgi:hypothetical protein